MATVTGLTAERMAEIEAASVVSGTVIDGRLYLTTRGEDVIDAGPVTGSPGTIDHTALENLDSYDHPNYHPRSGFPYDHTDGYQVILSYDESNRTVSLYPPGGSFDVYVKGVKFTYSGIFISDPHPATTGEHFLAHNGVGFAWTTNPWEFDWAHTCFVYYSETKGVGVPYFELHSADRDPSTHRRLHEVDGTQLVDGGRITDYISDSDIDSSKQFDVVQTTILDEDIKHILPPANGGDYTIWYRQGASGEWVWEESVSLPFKSGTYTQINDLVLDSWVLTEGSDNKWVNYYLFAVPALSANQQYILIPGQVVHSTLSAAQGDSLLNLNLEGLPFQEIAPLVKITYKLSASYTSTGKSVIAEVNLLIGSKASITQAAVTDHGALVGLGDDDHPQYVSELEHDKALHDALLIDADTLDGMDASDFLSSDTALEYTHIQAGPSFIWVIDHTLTISRPNVTVIDSGGSVVEGLIEYLSPTQIRLTFSAAFSGQAYLS